MAGNKHFLHGGVFGVDDDGHLSNSDSVASVVTFDVITAVDFNGNKYKKRQIQCDGGIVVIGDESDWI